jgi:hypothetical protein
VASCFGYFAVVPNTFYPIWWPFHNDLNTFLPIFYATVTLTQTVSMLKPIITTANTNEDSRGKWINPHVE